MKTKRLSVKAVLPFCYDSEVRYIQNRFRSRDALEQNLRMMEKVVAVV